MSRYILLVLSFLYSTVAIGQYDHVWAFGKYAGLDFNFDPPKPIQTVINTNEGCATICDKYGQLLFYTDGSTVWNRNHVMMPKGNDLAYNRTFSTSQAALIVPMPEDTNKYYVFSMSHGDLPHGKLYYSIVDMQLNGGFGDVIVKNIELDSGLTEHMATVFGDNCDIWLLVIAKQNSCFKSYRINAAGINLTPVLSQVLPERSLVSSAGIFGYIDIAPSRKKLAIAQAAIAMSVCDFNPNSGIVSNPIILDLDDKKFYYGISFSPDNSKVYGCIVDGHAGSSGEEHGIFQFDLDKEDSTEIVRSKTMISNTEGGHWNLKRAPNGMLYVIVSSGSKLSAITRPNNAGVSCRYVKDTCSMLPNTSFYIGLPSIIQGKTYYATRYDTVFCENQLLLTAGNLSGVEYRWSDGDTGTTRMVNTSGTYILNYEIPNPCFPGFPEKWSETFYVVFDSSYRENITTNHYQRFCQEDTLLLQAGNTVGVDYIWNDGSFGMRKKVNRSGIYWVSYQVDSLCMRFTDTFNVLYPEEPYRVSFTTDTLVCYGDTMLFHNKSHSLFDRFHWSFGNGIVSGDRDAQHSYQQPDTYIVQLIGHIGDVCTDTTSQIVAVDPVIPIVFLKNRSNICVGESVVFSQRIKTLTIVDLQWNLGEGSRQPGLGRIDIQHAYDKAGLAIPVTLNATFRACPPASYTDTLNVFKLPEVDLGPDSGLCLYGRPLTLKNQIPRKDAQQSFIWSTGATTESIEVTHPGIYTLTVQEAPLGCSTTESIEVRKDCYIDIPNAFTPNGDGHNDYFFPRQLLARSVRHFNMQVLNRWGQIVFETTSNTGRGWDGYFKGEQQPDGVYIYQITIEPEGALPEFYQGNVTLIR